jgi:predicted RNA-binding Zn ribbon-like protein
METPTFELSSGAVCLDLANTWGSRHDPAADRLRSYRDLVAWAAQAGLLAGDEPERLLARSERRQREAEAVLRRAVALRDAVHEVFARLAAGDDPAVADLETLNLELASALPRLRLRAGGGCCRWEWSGPEGALDRMLWPVVRSAAQLLTSDQVDRVRECASETCSWLFLDSSRNRRRKWCDMASCGNRAKARRYYARHRTG